MHTATPAGNGDIHLILGSESFPLVRWMHWCCCASRTAGNLHTPHHGQAFMLGDPRPPVRDDE